jgi:hypothetical protein
MNNIAVRVISSKKDIDQAVELYLDHTKALGTQVDRSEDDFKNWSQPGSKETLVYGCFQDETLTGMMRCSTWAAVPIYNINGLFTKKSMFRTYRYTENHPFPYIQNHIMSIMEAQGYYTWYHHRAIRPAYDRLVNAKEDLLRLCELGWDSTKEQYRYNRYTEAIIPAETLPKFKTFQHMLGKNLWKKDIMIVKCCLKQEYRIDGDIF